MFYHLIYSVGNVNNIVCRYLIFFIAFIYRYALETKPIQYTTSILLLLSNGWVWFFLYLKLFFFGCVCICKTLFVIPFSKMKLLVLSYIFHCEINVLNHAFYLCNEYVYLKSLSKTAYTYEMYLFSTWKTILYFTLKSTFISICSLYQLHSAFCFYPSPSNFMFRCQSPDNVASPCISSVVPIQFIIYESVTVFLLNAQCRIRGKRHFYVFTLIGRNVYGQSSF